MYNCPPHCPSNARLFVPHLPISCAKDLWTAPVVRHKTESPFTLRCSSKLSRNALRLSIDLSGSYVIVT